MLSWGLMKRKVSVICLYRRANPCKAYQVGSSSFLRLRDWVDHYAEWQILHLDSSSCPLSIGVTKSLGSLWFIYVHFTLFTGFTSLPIPQEPSIGDCCCTSGRRAHEGCDSLVHCRVVLVQATQCGLLHKITNLDSSWHKLCVMNLHLEIWIFAIWPSGNKSRNLGTLFF